MKHMILTKTSLLLLGVGFGFSSLFAANYTLKPGDNPNAVRDRIRADRKQGVIGPAESVTVTFAPGDYVFPQALELTEADTGFLGAPVTWRAEKRGSVRILGGRSIPRSAFVPVTDPAVLARLEPEARTRVLVCDVKPYLVKDMPVWPDHVRGTMPGPWLYRGGVSQTLARWPNKDAPESGFHAWTNVLANGGWGIDIKNKKPATFEFIGDRILRWHLDEGVWATGYFVVGWDCDTARLASYDPKTHGCTFACTTTWGVGRGEWPFYKSRFFVQNLLDELNAPGEWYLARREGKLYWIPDVDSATDEIILAQDLVPFVTVKKARYIRIENLSFAYTHGSKNVVSFGDCRDCVMKGCEFYNHGGAVASVMGERNRVTECSFHDLGCRGLYMGGGNVRTLVPANNLVDNCLFANFSMYQRTHANGITLWGCGNALRNCVITNCPDNAMGYSGNEHLIADNEFAWIALESGDVGCIYSGHHSQWLGTLLFGNYIHDLGYKPLNAGGRSGIYFDDCDWGDEVIGNILERTGMGVLLGGGQLHEFRNNLFISCQRGIACDGRGMGWRRNWRSSFNWDQSGRAFARWRPNEDHINPDMAPWSTVYPLFREALDDHPERPLRNVITNNVFQMCGQTVTYDHWVAKTVGKVYPGNEVRTNAAVRPYRTPQVLRLTDAVSNRLTSPDGSTVAEFSLDASGHFSWTLLYNGKAVLSPSPLGITIGTPVPGSRDLAYFNSGRKVIPSAAVAQVDALALKDFAVATTREDRRGGSSGKSFGVRNMKFPTPDVAKETARAFRIPVRDLITSQEAACLEVRVWKGGVAYRWIVPGQGERKVIGENNAFIPDNDVRGSFTLVEWGRDEDLDKGYPEAFYYDRGTGSGISFPEVAHGWWRSGDVITPWRGILCRPASPRPVK